MENGKRSTLRSVRIDSRRFLLPFFLGRFTSIALSVALARVITRWPLVERNQAASPSEIRRPGE